MNRFLRFIDRLRNPDADVARQLRKVFAVVLLGYLIVMVLLFLIYVLAAFAPHPLSLFLGDLLRVIPPAFRLISFLTGFTLLLLLFLRLAVGRRLRG